MTQEQLIIYLYGIYPEGGFTLSLIIISIICLFLWLPITEGGERLETPEHIKWKKVTTPLFTITIITTILGIFTPSKDTFLLLIATPTIVDSYTTDGGKLNRLDTLIDTALLKANKLLEEGK